MSTPSRKLPQPTACDQRLARTLSLAFAVLVFGALATLIKISFGGWVALGFGILGVGLLVAHLVTTVVFSWYLKSWETLDSWVVLAVLACCLAFSVCVADGGDVPNWQHWELLPARETWCGFYCRAATASGWAWLVLQSTHLLFNIVRIIVQVRGGRSANRA